MTWVGEDPASGVMIFTEDGTPGSVTGLPGQILTWKSLSGPSVKFEDPDIAVGIDIDYINGIQASGAPVFVYATGVATSFSSTVGAAYTSIPDMLLSSPPSGTYVCLFNSDVLADKSNREIQIAIFVDETEVASSQRNLTSSNANEEKILSTAGVAVNVDGTQDVEVRWRRVGASALWTIRGRTFSIFKAANNIG